MRHFIYLLLCLSWIKPITALAAPTAVSDAATTPGKTAITFSITNNDTNNTASATDVASTSFGTNTSAGAARVTTVTVSGCTFTLNDQGQVTFVPASTFTGVVSTTYFVRDAAGAASNRATIQVTVGPVANDDLVLVPYQTARTFQPLGNDLVASGASFNLATLDLDQSQAGVQSQLTLTQGTLQHDGSGNVTFTPAGTFTGSVPDVTYTVADTRTPATTSNAGAIRLRVGGRPFPCGGEFYQISQLNSTAQLFRLTRNTSGGTVNYTSTQVYDTGLALNALALSGDDGYLYAIGIGASNVGRVVQLSQDGAVDLGLMPGLPASGFNSATADNVGNYYLANNTTNVIYRANLRTFTATSITLSQNVQCGDIALDPTTGYLYASRYPSDLYRIDLASSSSPKPATTLRAASSGGDMGSLFFDASGALYGASNQGTFYLYDLSTGQSTSVGTANSSSQGDGASCVFPSQKLDVVKDAGSVVQRGATVFDVPYTIQVRNSSSAETPAVQVNEFLYSASGTNTTFPGATSVTLQAGPTVSGSLPAAAANPSFTGQGSNTGLLLGTQSLQAGQTVTIAFTARVTYPAGSVPNQAANTAYASTASASPNAGYQLLSDGTLVSPDRVLAVDRSTSGNTLPATANGDQPSPTVVTYPTPLPVGLARFTAEAVGTAVRLAWATASETTNSHFVVERATDGYAFVALGTVAGQGTSSQPHAYSWRDAGAAATSPRLYYRLRQVDYDGHTTYSPVRVVAAAARATAFLYPLPAGPEATLDLTALPAAANYPVVISDLAGRILARYTLAGGQAHPLDLRALPPGLSVVQVAGQTLRLLRQE